MLLNKRVNIGVHPPTRKEATKSKEITRLNPPQKVIIPLLQHVGKICKPIVSKGDEVEAGQKIGESTAFISSTVHSSISGRVIDVAPYNAPIGKKIDSVIIESTDEPGEFIYPNEKDFAMISAEELLKIIDDSGIVGLGGAGFPIQVKLRPPSSKKIDTYILNGAECEPYLTCDQRLMEEKPKQIIKGLQVLMKIVGVKKAYIAIEENKPEAIITMRRMSAGIEGVEVVPLRVSFPQGAEKQLIRGLLGRVVPKGGMPMDVGVLVNNVGTCYAVYEAVAFGKPLFERVITITGSGVVNPGNYLVKVGMLVGDVLEQIGGLKGKVGKVILGGPMMGVCQWTLDTPVTKDTTGVLVFTDEEMKEDVRQACIRCARCVDSCPVGISPTDISRFVENEKWDMAENYDISECIECGCCEYICPSKIPLIHIIKFGKYSIAQKKKEEQTGEQNGSGS